MFEVRKTTAFIDWLNNVKDLRARARIIARIDRVALGNLGDVKQVSEGISEMRFFFGPGYRIYFTQRKKTIIILLVGGNKSSQTSDIAKAKLLANNLE